MEPCTEASEARKATNRIGSSILAANSQVAFGTLENVVSGQMGHTVKTFPKTRPKNGLENNRKFKNRMPCDSGARRLRIDERSKS